jgi:aminoglycoside/choline kinase family phosphotransferase
MELLFQLFEQYTGARPTQQRLLTGSGSNRVYYRLWKDEYTYIGVYGADVKENHAFLVLSEQMAQAGIDVPQVLSVSADEKCYLLSDLGDESLFFDHIAQGFTPETVALLHQTIAQLPRIQFEVAKKLDFGICYPQSAFDQRTVFWDLNYFKYEFLKPSGIEFNEALLEDDFERLCHNLLQTDTPTFMYRDFQSRNVMIANGKPHFIDYQGGRKGPFYYDLVSFVYQAKAAFPDALRKELIETYKQALLPYYNVSDETFAQQVALFALFRTLQVLGAYGFRGLIEHKAHFIASIPFAINQLKQLLAENNYSQYPYLCQVLENLTARYETAVTPPCIDPQKLCVDVYSFSYKKGIPTDYSGNGGGFVFDCRAIHNPGRYEPYKKLTGLDQEVIDFLEEDGEMVTFMEHVYALADPAVARYLKRGFTHLQFSFGCTGGQHRSVYGAQHLAQHLADTFGVQVRLNHREQNITQLFNCSNA